MGQVVVFRRRTSGERLMGLWCDAFMVVLVLGALLWGWRR